MFAETFRSSLECGGHAAALNTVAEFGNGIEGGGMAAALRGFRS